MATEELVVVHANTGGQAEAVSHAPFVLGEQRFFCHRSANPSTLRAGVITVCLQLVFFPLGAGNKDVAVKRQADFAFEYRVGDFRRDALIAGLDIAGAGRFFAIQADIGSTEIPVAGVGQNISIAGVLVVVFRGCRRQAFARVVPELLLGAAGFEHELLLLIRGQPQACGAAVAGRFGEAVEDFVLVALLVVAPELNAETVFDQRTGHVPVQLRAVTCFGAVLEGVVRGYRP